MQTTDLLAARVRAGTYRVSVERDGYAPYSRDVIVGDAPAGGRRRRLDVCLEPIVETAGLVADGAGGPAPGAVVNAWRMDAGGEWTSERECRAGTDGRFAFGDLQRGSYRFVAVHPVVGWGESRLLEIDRARASAPLRIAVEWPTGALSGRVFDEEGRPVDGALVAVTLLDEEGEPKPYGGVSVATGARGEFAVAALPPGGLEVAAQHPRFDTAWETATLARGTAAIVDLRLRRRGGARDIGHDPALR